MNVVWTHSDAAAPDHRFAAPAVSELPGPGREGAAPAAVQGTRGGGERSACLRGSSRPESSGGNQEVEQSPSRLGDAAGLPTDCGFAGSRFGCEVCGACAEYEDYLMDGNQPRGGN